jgi:hypothetical protein
MNKGKDAPPTSPFRGAARAVVLVVALMTASACASTTSLGAGEGTPVDTAQGAGTGASTAARILAAAGDADVPPWLPSGVDCKDDPMAHVHDPYRFELLSGCSTVSGTVIETGPDEPGTELVKAFGDYKISVRLDEGEERFLPEANAGVLSVAVIPTDRPWINIPSLGEHATFYGAWVRHVDGDAVEMHPAWAIQRDGADLTAEALHDIRVSIQAPASVILGQRIDPLVHVSAAGDRPRQLHRPVHLFLELLTPGGDGVAWKGGETNTIRFAAIDLIALQIPGEYELVVHAWAGHHHGVATAPVTIRRA